MLRFGFVAQDLVNAGRLEYGEIRSLREKLYERGSHDGDDHHHVPQLTDEQIATFLLSCTRDQEATLKTIRAYYNAKIKWPQLFDSRNVENEELAKQLDVVQCSVFPQRTDDGCCIIFHKLSDTSYSHYFMSPAMKLLFMVLDAALYDNPPNGLIIMFDMKGVGLMHLTRVKLDLVKAFFYYLQEALPVRLNRIHVLNSVYFIDKVMALIKPFIKAEVYENLHFHSSSMDMNDFYDRWIPKRCLPEDYGGDLPPLEILHKDIVKRIDQLKNYFEDEEKQRHPLQSGSD